MSITIGDAILYLRGDRSQLNRDLDKSEQDAQTWSQRIGEKINQELGKKLAKVGGMLTAAVTAPLVALASGAIDAASDLDESLSKVNVVFGESATEIEAWSEKSAEAFGQSQQQALEAVGTYGNLFTAMGIGQKAASGMSMGLVELASDLASFNNIDPTVALEKLRAGLTGETEPLKALGVNLSAATIATKAMEMGLVELSVDTDKVTRLTLDLEKAQGELSSITRGASTGSLEYKKAQLAVADAQERLNKLSKEGVSSSTEYKAAQKKLAEAQDTLNTMVTKYGSDSDLARLAQEQFYTAQERLNEVARTGTGDSVEYQKAQLALAEAQQKLGEMTKGASTNSLEYRDQAAKVEEIQKKLNAAIGGEATELTAAQKAQAAYALILEQTTNAQGDFQRTSEGLANQQRITTAMFENAKAQLGEKLLPIKLKLVQMVQGLIEKFTNLSPKTQEIILLVAGLAAGLGPLLMVAGGVVTTITALAPVVGAAGAAIAALVSPIGLAILAVGALIAIGVLVIKNWETIKKSATEIWTELERWLSKTWEGIRKSAVDLWNRVADSVRDAVEKARRWAVEKFTLMVDWFRELPGRMVDAGRDIVEGLKEGIRRAWDTFMRWIKDKLNGFKDAVLGFFGIHSPSAMFADVGRQLMAGLGAGIESGVEIPVRASLALGENLAGILAGNSASAGNSYMTVYGGLALHGVQDRQSLLQEMQGMMV